MKSVGEKLKRGLMHADRASSLIKHSVLEGQTPQPGGPFSLDLDLQESITIGQRAMHLAFITMLIREDDAAGSVYSHKVCRMSIGFLPLFDRGTLPGRRLAKKAVIKDCLGMFSSAETFKPP